MRAMPVPYAPCPMPYAYLMLVKVVETRVFAAFKDYLAADLDASRSRPTRDR
jgi:hypothetical protein